MRKEQSVKLKCNGDEEDFFYARQICGRPRSAKKIKQKYNHKLRRYWQKEIRKQYQEYIEENANILVE